MSETMLREALAMLRQYGKCTSCGGTGLFDHHSGEGTIGKCIYDDRNNPRHRYCDCERCGATGLEPEVGAFVARHDEMTGRAG